MALQQAIRRDLSAHQRQVVVAVALRVVPIGVRAERLNVTRGALYKALYDARRILRMHLGAARIRLCGVLATARS